MALMRDPWIRGGAITCAASVVLLLPPRQAPTEPPTQALPAMGMSIWGLDRFATDQWHFAAWRRGEAARTSVRSRLQQRLAVMDATAELRARAAAPAAIHSTVSSLTVVGDGSVSADSLRFWLRMADAELAAYPSGAGSTGAPVIILASAHRQSLRDNPLPSLIQGESGDPTCYVRLTLDSIAMRRDHLLRRRNGIPRRGTFLGACAPVARYGEPGALGRRLSRVDSWYGDDWSGSQMEFGAQRIARRAYGSLVGRRSGDRMSWQAEACLRGDDGSCESLLAGRQVFMPWGSYYTGDGVLRNLTMYLLLTRPVEPYTRLWRSDADPVAALADAYGEPPARLVRAFLTAGGATVPEAGPMARASLFPVAALWIVLLLSIGCVSAVRRSVSR